MSELGFHLGAYASDGEQATRIAEVMGRAMTGLAMEGIEVTVHVDQAADQNQEESRDV